MIVGMPRLPKKQPARKREKRESLRALLRDLIKQYGKPSAKDVRWAERALAPREKQR